MEQHATCLVQVELYWSSRGASITQLQLQLQLLITIVYTVDIFELYLVFITDCTVLNIPL